MFYYKSVQERCSNRCSYYLKTGKQASDSTESFLLNVLSEGEEKRNDFVTDCEEDSARFERPIKKSKIVNFATENFQRKNTSKKAAAIAQTKGTCDTFGRLLFLSIQRQIDIRSVFQHPLLPEPVCFAHPDGSIRNCPKSKVFHFLKTEVTSTPPTTVKTVIVDGMFLLRACIGKCATYQVLARRILQDALKLTSYRIDTCFGVYESPSIKDVERKVRGDENTIRIFSIGPKHKIEGNIKELLQLSNYKNELLRFLYNEYQDPAYAVKSFTVL